MALRAGRWLQSLSPRRRLSTRFVLLFLGLLFVVQAAGHLALTAQLERYVVRQLERELGVATTLWRTELDARAAVMQTGTALLARDTGFREAIGKHDEPTVASALVSLADRIGATAAAAFGPAGESLGHHALDAPDALPAMQAAAAAFLRQPRRGGADPAPQATIALVGRQPYQFVLAPLPRQVRGGALVMGFPLDRALLDIVKGKTGLDVALEVDGAAVTLATLDDEVRAALATRGDARGRMDLGGRAVVVRPVALAEGLPARVLLVGWVDDGMKAYQATLRDLAWITVVGLVLVALGGLYTARRVTTPLAALVDAARRLGSGDYSQAPGHTDRVDEVGKLAQAFDQMRRDIDEQQRKVQRAAYFDHLTGLPNRARLLDALQDAIGREPPGGAVSVVMLDLDRFKPVNDRLGWAFGDGLLKEVASRLQREVARRQDLVARLSGDEFALLLPGADADAAVAVAERLARAFEEPVAHEGQRVDLQAGFGVASWPAHGGDADTLLRRAEVAMYAAKQQMTRVVCYAASIDVGSDETLTLLSDLRRAIERDELRLHLQPKTALADGRLVGAEALVRWQHPVDGLVPPARFIPFAEQTGFIRQLTLWVFEEAARHWTTLHALGLKRVSVNLSVRDLLDPELPDKLAAILARHALPASGFCLEITESAVMTDPERSKQTLQRLAAAGFRLSMDDFGEGQTALRLLRDLPLHELKIDMGFVRDMDRNPHNAMIVRSIVDLARNLGLSVVAEGVENAASRDLLAAMACDEGQGWHFGKPMPAADLPGFAARWQARQTPEGAAALPGAQ